jgi:class 3 adenylate cyclase
MEKIMGDAVNIASRIQSLGRAGGVLRYSKEILLIRSGTHQDF